LKCYLRKPLSVKDIKKSILRLVKICNKFAKTACDETYKAFKEININENKTEV
jgi:hypothetical protein